MLTRSTRKLPSDFPLGGPSGRRKLLAQRDERPYTLTFLPKVQAAFPTLDRPVPPSQEIQDAERPRWTRGAGVRNGDNEGAVVNVKRRRIDLTEGDLYNELMGDNKFLNAGIGCAEVELQNFGDGDYRDTYVPAVQKQEVQWCATLDPCDPGQLDVPLFWDEESCDNWGHNLPVISSFKALSGGVKMAIMVEAVAAYNIKTAPEMLMLTQEDIDDYAALYDREAANDAAIAHNMKKVQEWETKLRKKGVTNFAAYKMPPMRAVADAALSLIKRADVDAGQRYLTSIGQSKIAERLRDYIGYDSSGSYKFKHPPLAKRGAEAQNDALLATAVEMVEISDSISVASDDEEILVMDTGRGHPSATQSIVSANTGLAVQSRGQKHPRDDRVVATKSQDMDSVDAAGISARKSIEELPLLARPARRRGVQQKRTAEPKLPQLPRDVAVDNIQLPPALPLARVSPNRNADPMLEPAHTPPTSTGTKEFAGSMFSTVRRSISRPEDEPEFARNIASSPIAPVFTAPRGPRIAHVHYAGQNPARHSSGSHPKSATKASATKGDQDGGDHRNHLKLKIQLSEVYRPERVWNDRSSSPLRATTPRPVTPRSGSKEKFLSERAPSHPPSSPRLFDEGGKTVRDRPRSEEEVLRIFKMQEEEAERRRLFGQETAPILPPSSGTVGYQAPFSGLKISNHQAPQASTPNPVTPRQPPPILPPKISSAGSYQAPFAGAKLSAQRMVQVAISAQGRPHSPSHTTAPGQVLANRFQGAVAAQNVSHAPDQTFVPATPPSTLAQGTSNAANLGNIGHSNVQPQHQTPQAATGRAQDKRPEVMGDTNKARPMKQKVRRTKTTPASAAPVPPESTEGRLSPPKFETPIKPLGPPKLKSTYVPQAQVHPRPPERQLYRPPQRRENAPQIIDASARAPLIPATPQLPNHQAKPNAIKRAHTVQGGLPSDGQGQSTSSQQTLNQQTPAFGYYNNSFAAHSKATFEQTRQDFSRIVPKPVHPNQYTSERANALQGPVSFNAPRATKNPMQSSASISDVPNPFRAQRQTQPAGNPLANGAEFAQPPPPVPSPAKIQTQEPPAKKQKVAHKPAPVPALFDLTGRASNPSPPLYMPAAMPPTPDTGSSRELTPEPNMPGGGLSGVLVMANSNVFAQQMKNMGVPYPAQTAASSQMKMKRRNVASKVMPMTAPHAAPPTAPPTPRPSVMSSQGRPETPVKSQMMTKAKGSGGGSGSARKRKGEREAGQSDISRYFTSPSRPSGSGGMF